MTRTRDQRVLMAAMSVAMRARVNDLDALAVDDLVVQAGQLLADNDPLARAITGFATQYMLVRHSRDELAREGEVLMRAVELGAMPDVVDPDRVDIHG